MSSEPQHPGVVSASAGPKRDLRGSALRRRLALAYVLLGAAVLAAAAVGIYFGLIRSNKATSWSAWKPTSTDLQTGLTQITDHVSPRYPLTNGKPQASIHFSPVQIDNQQIRAIGIAKKTTSPPSLLTLTQPGDSVLFQLCGTQGGASCPPVESGATSNLTSYSLRQEGLELALYTLKYLPSVQTVVIVFGAKPFDPGALAEVYIRTALEQAKLLSSPLDRTLAAPTPPAEQKLTPAQRRGIVSRAGHLYQWTLTKAPNGQPAIVIAPAPEPKVSG